MILIDRTNFKGIQEFYFVIWRFNIKDMLEYCILPIIALLHFITNSFAGIPFSQHTAFFHGKL